MDDLSSQLTQFKTKLTHSLGLLCSQVEQLIPSEVETAWNSYINALSTTGKNDIIHDLSHFNITPATTTIAVTAFTAVIFFSKLLKSSSAEAPKTAKIKKKKKPSKAQRANTDIQHILDFVEETYVPQIDEYLEKYATLSDNDKEYKYKYFEEMLLKELMKLDGVDVAGNEVLRENRRKVIKFIQEHQRRLDKFKQEKDKETKKE